MYIQMHTQYCILSFNIAEILYININNKEHKN